MREQEIKKLFPELTSSNFRITSDPTEEYNCIAWAADDTDAWWWPDPQYVAYWPSNVARVETIDAFVEVFELFGYTICTDGMHEKDVEKITILLFVFYQLSISHIPCKAQLIYTHCSN